MIEMIAAEHLAESVLKNKGGKSLRRQIPQVAGRAQVFPVLTRHKTLKVGHTGADSKKQTSGAENARHFGEGPVQIVDMLEDMDCDDEIKRSIGDAEALNIPFLDIQALTLGVGQRGLRIIDSLTFESGIVFDRIQEIALPAAYFQCPDGLVLGEIARDPTGEDPVF